MGDCNPACQKIIINSGLIVPAADLLASLTQGPVSTTATQLASAARALRATYDDLAGHNLITLVNKTGSRTTSNAAAKSAWKGCDEAKTLWSWIAEARRDAEAFILQLLPAQRAAHDPAKGEEAVARMRQWMIELDAQGLALTAAAEEEEA